MENTEAAVEAYKVNPEFISGALNRLLRGPPNSLQAYLSQVSPKILVKGTKSSVHCHCIANDGNEVPRFRDLAQFLADRVVDYAIPRSEIERAKARDEIENSSASLSALKRKANSLFADLKKTGEGGELLLYLLAQNFLKFPQLLSKMPLKTNSNMFVHGVDGIHVWYDEISRKLLLYWGESKLYGDLKSAIENCLAGLKHYLTDSGGSSSPLERDIFLLRDNIDLLDENLEAALLVYLDRDNPAFNSVEYRGVALIGFDSAYYPTNPHKKTTQKVIEDLVKEHTSWIESIKDEIESLAPLSDFTLELFLIPFPNVQSFRDAFLAEIGHGK